MYVNTVDGACEQGPTLGQGIYVKMLHLQGGKIYIYPTKPRYTPITKRVTSSLTAGTEPCPHLSTSEVIIGFLSDKSVCETEPGAHRQKGGRGGGKKRKGERGEGALLAPRTSFNAPSQFRGSAPPPVLLPKEFSLVPPVHALK